jgi:hypothetical protein
MQGRSNIAKESKVRCTLKARLEKVASAHLSLSTFSLTIFLAEHLNLESIWVKSVPEACSVLEKHRNIVERMQEGMTSVTPSKEIALLCNILRRKR